jgi:hypothetical protein
MRGLALARAPPVKKKKNSSHTLVDRVTGTPKDKDEVNRRDFTSVMGEYVFLKR